VHWILTNVFATQAGILTSESSTSPYRSGFILQQNAPLPKYLSKTNTCHSFGTTLSPVHFPRIIS
jgi:hypothetical protein